MLFDCQVKYLTVKTTLGLLTHFYVSVGKKLVCNEMCISNRPLSWGTGIGGLMRGMATLPQGNQKLLVVRDKVGRPQVSLG